LQSRPIRKIELKKISNASKKIKNTQRTADTKDSETHDRQRLDNTVDKTPAPNSGLAQWGQTW
jgi:hypothetical protein